MADRERPTLTRRQALQVGSVTAATLAAGCAEEQVGGLGSADATSSDAAAADAAVIDSGVMDAGALDAEAADAAENDAGQADAGAPDADATDADAPDAGEQTDAGDAEGDAGAGPQSSGFPLGVASGDVTADRAILWTRYTGSASLRLVVWAVTNGTLGAELMAIDVTAGSGGFLQEDVSDLDADTPYAYAFFEIDGADVRIARSRIGRFVTALAPDAMQPLVLGACSCTNNGRRFDTIAHAAGRTDLAAFLLLGDTTYNDGARTLTEYRDKWAENLGTDAYKALRASTSLVSTWDDHEVTNDWTGETIDASRLSASTRAIFDNLPLRRDPMDPDRIYKRLRWGLTAELFVLDCRRERRPSTRTTPQAEYISTAQMDWLKAGLAASPAVFKIILNSVPIADLPGLFDLAAADRWEGYSAQRREILTHIDDQNIDGVIWLAGDLHLAYGGRVAASGPGSNQLEILAGPGAQASNPLSRLLNGPQFDFAFGTNNYLALHLNPGSREARAVHHDANGMTISDMTWTL